MTKRIEVLKITQSRKNNTDYYYGDDGRVYPFFTGLGRSMGYRVTCGLARYSSTDVHVPIDDEVELWHRDEVEETEVTHPYLVRVVHDLEYDRYLLVDNKGSVYPFSSHHDTAWIEEIAMEDMTGYVSIEHLDLGNNPTIWRRR